MGLRLKCFGLMAYRHALSAGLAFLLPCLAMGGIPLQWSNGLMESHDYVIISAEGVPIGEIHQEVSGVTGRGGQENLKAEYEIVRQSEGPDGRLTTGKTTSAIVFNRQNYDLYSRLDTYSYASGQDLRVTFTPTPAGVEVVSERQGGDSSGEAERRLIEFDVAGPLVDQLAFVFLIRGLPLEKGHSFSATTVNPSRKGDVEWQKGMVLGPRQVPWDGGQVEAWVIETATSVGVTVYHVLPDAPHTLIRYTSPRGEVYQLLPEKGD